MAYSYNPAECMDGGLNQMRMELGDTVVETEGVSCALCDEEYQAILNAYPKQWKKAKLKCLQTILMRLSYEVDTDVDGLSYSLNQRAERWQKMYDKLKKNSQPLFLLQIREHCLPQTANFTFTTICRQIQDGVS